MSVGPPILEILLFHNLTLEVQGQAHSWRSHSGFNILLTHIPFVSCKSTLPSLRYSFHKIWILKSKVNVMDEVKIQSHKVGTTSYWLTSLLFHVNQSSHSWDMAFTWPKFGLENTRSRSWERSNFKATNCVPLPTDSHPFPSVSIGDTAFSASDLENPRSRS